MPGMMDTVLNLGLNDETVEGLGEKIRRPGALPMTATGASSPHIPTSCSASATNISRNCSTSYKERQGYSLDTDLSADDWAELV